MAERKDPGAPPRWADSRADAVGGFLASAREVTQEPARFGARQRGRARFEERVRPRGPRLGALAFGGVAMVAALIGVLAVTHLPGRETPRVALAPGAVASAELDVRGQKRRVVEGAKLGAETQVHALHPTRLLLGAATLELAAGGRLLVPTRGAPRVLEGVAAVHAPGARAPAVLAVGNFVAEIETGSVRFEVASAQAFSVVVYEGRVVLRGEGQRLVLTRGQAFRVGEGPGAPGAASAAPAAEHEVVPTGSATASVDVHGNEPGSTPAAASAVGLSAHGSESGSATAAAAGLARYGNEPGSATAAGGLDLHGNEPGSATAAAAGLARYGNAPGSATAAAAGLDRYGNEPGSTVTSAAGLAPRGNEPGSTAAAAAGLDRYGKNQPLSRSPVASVAVPGVGAPRNASPITFAADADTAPLAKKRSVAGAASRSLDGPSPAPIPAASHPAGGVLPSAAEDAPSRNEERPRPLSTPARQGAINSVPLEHARELTRESHFAAAASSYRALITGDSAQAQVALYELARLQLLRLKDISAAERALRESLRRFPDGILVQEVSLSLIDADLRLHQWDQALTDADGFLTRFPTNERGAEVRLVRANLWRQSGDCGRALPEYQQLQLRPAQAGDALFHEATCQAQLGHAQLARNAFAEYRSRFPQGTFRTQAEKALGDGKMSEGRAASPTSTNRQPGNVP